MSNPSDERRQTVRTHPGQETTCHVSGMAGTEFIPATVRNLSSTGIGLVLDRPLHSLQTITVAISNQAGTFSFQVPVRVVYHIEQPDGRFILGGLFSRELTDEEVRGLASG